MNGIPSSQVNTVENTPRVLSPHSVSLFPGVKLPGVKQKSDCPRLDHSLHHRSMRSIPREKNLLAPEQEARLNAVAGATRHGLNSLVAAQIDRAGLTFENQVQYISDHLPVSHEIISEETGDIILVASWNILSETHHNNSYLSISLPDELQSPTAYTKLAYYQQGDRLSTAWLLYDLAEEIANSALFNNEYREAFLTGSPKGMDRFFQFLEKYPYLETADLKLSRFYSEEQNKSRRIESREFLANLARSMIQQSIQQNGLGDCGELYAMAISAFKLHYSINGSGGSIKLNHRHKAFANNTKILSKLRKHDFICLQECSDPDFVLQRLNKKSSKKYDYIAHKANDRPGNKDYCVILFDTNKWQIKSTKLFTLHANKKPEILAKFSAKSSLNISNLDDIIVGSLHYPGGNQNTNELITVRDVLSELNPDGQSSYIMVGDFNQLPESLEEKSRTLGKQSRVVAPKGGTMSGSDWGNKFNGKTIDMSISNFPMHQAAIFI